MKKTSRSLISCVLILAICITSISLPISSVSAEERPYNYLVPAGTGYGGSGIGKTPEVDGHDVVNTVVDVVVITNALINKDPKPLLTKLGLDIAGATLNGIMKNNQKNTQKKKK